MAENKEKTEVQVLQNRDTEFALSPVGQTIKKFEVVQRMATMYSQSTIIPDTYKGNIGNCAIALDIADRMNAAPLMVIQNLYIVHGNPSFSSKFLIATINASGRFSPLRYEFKGTEGKEDYGCRCYAYEKGDDEKKEPLYGDLVTMKMAISEGLVAKNGSKWKSMPSQMLRYRAAAFWCRVYAPELSMGFPTKEEVDDYTDYEEISSVPNHEFVESTEVVDTTTGEIKPKEEKKVAAKDKTVVADDSF